MCFKDKVVIVTGAGQGIGYEICRQLVASKAHVLLNDINIELAQQAVASLNEKYGNFAYEVGGDCSNLISINKIVDHAIINFGKLDIVIANAGITLFGDFLTYSPESFMRVMQVNLSGSFFLAQVAAEKMKMHPSGGSILFMSSVTAHLAHKGLAVYGMTKAALESLARNLVIELAPYNININTVAPGATLTERTTEDKNYEDTWNKITPNGRAAKVNDIANAVLFLVNDNSRHINGQNLIVDGGWTSIGHSPE